MTSNEVARLRRQMQRRIRDVVAERRITRQENSLSDEGGETRAVSDDAH